MEKEKISESEAEGKYREMLDETKHNWINNYYGGDVLREIDETAYYVGFRDYKSSLDDEYEIEE